jgi:hypothetical protein
VLAILIFVVSYLIIGLLVTFIAARFLNGGYFFLAFPFVIFSVFSWPYVLIMTIHENLRYKRKD